VATNTYGVKQLTLYYWQKIYMDNGCVIKGLDLKTQISYNKK